MKTPRSSLDSRRRTRVCLLTGTILRAFRLFTVLTTISVVFVHGKERCRLAIDLMYALDNRWVRMVLDITQIGEEFLTSVV